MTFKYTNTKDRTLKTDATNHSRRVPHWLLQQIDREIQDKVHVCPEYTGSRIMSRFNGIKRCRLVLMRGKLILLVPVVIDFFG